MQESLGRLHGSPSFPLLSFARFHICHYTPQVPDEDEKQVPAEAIARGDAILLVGLPSEGPRVYRRGRAP